MGAYINKIKWNDCVNGNGIVVSIWFQGCENNCPACHNPETHSYDTSIGTPYSQELEDKIIEGLNKNGTIRNLSLLGGEPFSKRNYIDIYNLIRRVRKLQEKREIIIWTGFTLEELVSLNNVYVDYILQNIDYLVDGKFEITERDISLKWRGSPNQRILTKEDIIKELDRDDSE